jgi:nucleoside-diphosphate-sugar epimerase
MNGQRALVTGSAGFIGRHMTAELLRRGWDVVGVDIAPGRYGWQAELTQWLQQDKTRYDLVCHFAAWTPHRAAIDAGGQMHLNNRLLDTALFQWAVRTEQGRVLYPSSCAVLDVVPDAYGRQKLAGEELATLAIQEGVPVTVIRPYSGYGEDQSTDFPFGAFIARAIARESPFEVWGTGQQVRDFIHVDDIVHEALAAVEVGTLAPVSLCTGVGTSLRELAALVTHEAGYDPPIRTRPELNGAADRRVGVPGFVRPKISLRDGVRRALEFHGVRGVSRG